MIEVVGCATGAKRYSGVAERVQAAGGSWSTTECFDRCDACERFLIARVDGALMRLANTEELIHAVATLSTANSTP